MTLTKKSPGRGGARAGAGRKPTPANARKKPVNAKLLPYQYEFARLVSVAHGVSKAEAFRIIIDDAAFHHGVLGTLLDGRKRLPEDSTLPARFRRGTAQKTKVDDALSTQK